MLRGTFRLTGNRGKGQHIKPLNQWSCLEEHCDKHMGGCNLELECLLHQLILYKPMDWQHTIGYYSFRQVTRSIGISHMPVFMGNLN